jgi:hypothetical protein
MIALVLAKQNFKSLLFAKMSEKMFNFFSNRSQKVPILSPKIVLQKSNTKWSGKRYGQKTMCI